MRSGAAGADSPAGAAGAALLAIFNRKMNWQVLRDSAYATMKTTSMVMMLFIGGKFFSTVFLSMGGGVVVADLMIGGGLNRWAVLGIMMFIVFIMGMFIDWAAILLITIPIFMPIVKLLGFDPVWFGVLIMLLIETAMITPPWIIGRSLVNTDATASWPMPGMPKICSTMMVPPSRELACTPRMTRAGSPGTS